MISAGVSKTLPERIDHTPTVSRRDLDALPDIWRSLAIELEKRHLIEVQE